MGVATTEQGPIVIHGPLTGAGTPVLEEVPAAPAREKEEPVPTIFVGDAAAQLLAPAVEPKANASSEQEERSDGLDAFRALLLILMNFSFTISLVSPLPAWMYHVQYPPPDGAFTELAGLAWRDMLYAGFMFTMSAALPITLGARLLKRAPYPELVWTALRRCFMLYVFATVMGHVNSYWTGQENKLGNAMSIGGFFLLFALFVRPRRDWNPVRVQWLRLVGWLGVVTLFFLSPAIYGEGFNLLRRDEIIASIGWVALAVTVVWLFTRANHLARLGILAVLVALRTGAQYSEWIAGIWYWTPAQVVYEPWFAEMLFIAIPGTIAGDLIVSWMSRERDTPNPVGWSNRKLAALAIIGLTLVPIALVGLWQRQAVAATTAIYAALSAVVLVATRKAVDPGDQVLRRMFTWSAFFIMVAMLTEPLEGGIKKVPLTFSYLVLMTGLSFGTLASLTIAFDHFQLGKRLRALVQIGQNPLLAYVIINLFLMHVLWYVGVAGHWRDTAPAAIARSVLITAAGTFLVWLASKKRIYWRS